MWFSPADSMQYVNKSPLGENISRPGLSGWDKELVVSNLSRVTASRISIPPYDTLATAMNLLHGDQAVTQILLACLKVVAFESHVVGIPYTSLTKGLAYGSYTMDVLGDNGTAECTDDPKEHGHKLEAVIDNIKGWKSLTVIDSVKGWRSLTQCLQVHSELLAKTRSCLFIDKVFVPRLACIFQSRVDVLLGPFLQVLHLRVGNGVWEFAHVLFQYFIHQLKAAFNDFMVMMGREDIKSLAGALSWISDEVRKGFVEGLDWVIIVSLEDERMN
ncbi:hypothetical protein BJ322DRAFT_1215246 [Thelephora terrestris]|uniref:Uncharacterized protein n=1 Tax=Thelephora terrestris TaxID=56493 RepID=A0A9P6HNQ5_9AGAM|nr:hypothetical protein BJ322DRAFT_1215246 [Thelephora terrestris]